MMELIDREKEQARLAKEKAQCEKEIASMGREAVKRGLCEQGARAHRRGHASKHAAAAEKLAKIGESIRNLG